MNRGPHRQVLFLYIPLVPHLRIERKKKKQKTGNRKEPSFLPA